MKTISSPPNTSFTTSYSVRSGECDSDGFLRFPALCDYLQETAAGHAMALGLSKGGMGLPANLTWMLTRLRVELERYPKWRDEVVVLTFPRGMRKLFAYRDFEFSLADGTPVGRASSEWMVVNMETRRAQRIPDDVAAIANTVRAPVLGEAPFTKFEFGGDVTSRKTFVAQHSHIDVNGHVNNVRYHEWMLEAAPPERRRPLSCEAVFRDEVTEGESVAAEFARPYMRVSTGGKECVVAKALQAFWLS